MLLSDFDFELPDEAIARHPQRERDGSRLMVVRRAERTFEHRTFSDLPELLSAGDLLVYNDSKVLPARLRAKKKETGGRVEILLVQEAGGPKRWRAMVNASKGVKVGASLILEGLEIKVAADEGEGFVVLELPEDALSLAHRFGEIPLPPYLGRAEEAEDRERYQTVFARPDAEGSVAAPTAGLHFTPRVLEALAARGIERAAITLHVGPGTFLPVRTEEVEKHRMLAERYEIDASTARALNDARARGRKIVAVGTTATRVLETEAARSEAREAERVVAVGTASTRGLETEAARSESREAGRAVAPGTTATRALETDVVRSEASKASLAAPGAGAPPPVSFSAGRGATDLFIRPGHQFRAIDALLTNFHLPRSTLIMLVSAFAGRELILDAYREAVARNYRFFSYGDAMLIS